MFSRRVQPRSDSESSKVGTQEATALEIPNISTTAQQQETAEVCCARSSPILTHKLAIERRYLHDPSHVCSTLQVAESHVSSVQEETGVSAAQEDTNRFAALTIKAGREISIDAENVPTKADSKTPTFG